MTLLDILKYLFRVNIAGANIDCHGNVAINNTPNLDFMFVLLRYIVFSVLVFFTARELTTTHRMPWAYVDLCLAIAVYEAVRSRNLKQAIVCAAKDGTTLTISN